MAAGEDQAQAVVGHRALLGRRVAGVHERGLGVAVVARGLAAQAVDGPVARRGDDPAGGRRGQSVLRPPPRGHGEGVLDRLLGDVEVAEDAVQDGDGTAVLLTEDPLDVGRACDQARSEESGRTSIGSVVAAAKRPAHSRAPSRSSAARIVNPPTCSLPST